MTDHKDIRSGTDGPNGSGDTDSSPLRSRLPPGQQGADVPGAQITSPSGDAAAGLPDVEGGLDDGALNTGTGARAWVVVPDLASHGANSNSASKPTHDPIDRLQETVGLANAINLNVMRAQIVTLSKPKAGTLFGTGKIDEIGKIIEADDIELAIIDHSVTPIQQRNLETAWNCKVLDRTGLILEIFGERARTKEGRLQVELAHLTYQKGRLVRSWTHLERQRGGAGFLGGPGERQIELDRRMISARITAIKKDLEVVVKTRELHRSGRRRVPYPVIALVGYTNAGKSTLFNRLTGANVFAQDQVFATLDPTMREITLASGRRAIASDTVGFISDLPTMLIAAFRATLEEVIEADLILHLRDISHEFSDAQAADVNKILTELGVVPDIDAGNILEVWNKADLLDPAQREALANKRQRAGQSPVLVSAVTGEGIGELLAEIDTRLGRGEVEMTVQLSPGDGALVNWLHENSEVLSQEVHDDGGATYALRLSKDRAGKLRAKLGDNQ